MQNWRVIYIGAIILAVVFMAIARDNDNNNMAPFEYLNKTNDLLDKAKTADVFSEKMQFINESIATYGQGPSLDKLQLLALANTSDQANFMIPALKLEISDEYSSHRNGVHAFKVALSEFAFFFVALVGIFLNWNTLKDEEKHIVWSVTITLLLLILVLI